jgi:hypothetical protein
MEARMPINPLFIGTWELIPEKSSYELGQPPRSGTYRISESGEGYAIDMTWTTPQGAPAALSYRAIPDDKRYTQEDTSVADETSMTDVGPRQLDTRAFKGGNVILHASRILSADGDTMDVCQTGVAPDGSQYRNRSVYRRV